MEFMNKIMGEPLWLQTWVFWMMIINTASIIFIKHRGAQVALGCWIGNMIFMSLLFEQVGYVRLLGLPHVVFWTPLVIYLVMTWRQHRGKGLFSAYIMVLIATNTISLVIDYIDVIRYLLGEREPMA